MILQGLVSFIIVFVILIFSYVYQGESVNLKQVAKASLVFVVLSILPLPLPFIISICLPPIGLYMVLIGDEYWSHDKVKRIVSTAFAVHLIAALISLNVT